MAEEDGCPVECLLFVPLHGHKQHPHGLYFAKITGRILVWVSKHLILQLTKPKGAMSEIFASEP